MLEQIISTLDEGLVALDHDLRYVFVNDAAERLTGLTRDQILGRRLEELLPRAVVDQALPHVRAALATSQPVTFDTHLPETQQRFENRLYPLPDGGVTILFVDVTERRRAADLVRKREAMQALVVSLLEETRELRDADEVVWTCVRGLGTHLRVARCMFGEIDAGAGHVSVSRDYTDGVRSVAGRHRLEDLGLTLATELRAGQSIAVHDAWTDPRTADATSRAALDAIGARALIVVPLLKAGQLVALLSVHHAAPREWTTDERALLERLAEQTWFAVANARAEAALRESRDVLALAMRGGRMGAWSRNLATDEVWWSRELEEIFALPPGGFAGTDAGFFAFVHEDDRARVEAAVTEAIRSRSDYVVEFRFRAGDRWRWMDGRGSAIYGEDGTPSWLYGIGIDITERKCADQALASAREAAAADAARLHLAMAAAALGDWSWDVASDVVTLSSRGAEIFGVGAGQQYMWSQLRDRVHPDDRERARVAVEGAVRTRSDYAIEYRVVHEGRERWISARGRLRFDAAGQPLAMQGIVQDVSHDRLLVYLDDAVRNLAATADIASTAARMVGQQLNADHCSYLTVADDGTLVATGSHSHDLHGVGHDLHAHFEALLRGPWRDGGVLVSSEAATDPMLADRYAARDTPVPQGAVIVAPILKAGRLMAGLAVHTTTPRVWQLHEIGLVQQVASRCWESIQRARSEEERTALLARERLARLQAEEQNRRLAQLSEAAEAASRAKDEFMAMLGHELRNPLAPILTALQLMRLRGDVSSDRERVVIERQVKHLTRLVDDLLDVSRITRGKVELKLAPVETAEVVARAIEIASPLLEDRSHTLTVDVPRSGLPMLVDPARLSQVIANLLTNAARYTPQGGVIAVTARGDGDEVHVAVRDSGIGIAADLLPTVFDLFVQGRQASDRAEGGLGLGLAIVRNLVERHGGRVRAQSDGPGTGSNFGVWVPRAPTQANATEPPPARRPGAPTAAPNRIWRVLIVDDNGDAADMLAHVLRSRGHDTRVAHDGVEALRACGDFAPDVAFLDLGLPVMDGYELASRLRALPGLSDVRLIAVTGYGQESDRRRTSAAGFQHHLVKPVDIATLETLLT